MNNTGDPFMGAVYLVVLILLYFAPWLIGVRRGLATTGFLFVINLLAGWTVVGWFACLIWAAVGSTKAQDDFYRNQGLKKEVAPSAAP